MTRKQILLADADPTMCRVIAATLGPDWYDLSQVCDGQQALELVQQVRPDLVILEARLAVVSGFEVCRRLKADPVTAPIPIAMVTSVASQAEAEACLRNGAAAYLVKPFSPVRLLATVESLLGASSAAEGGASVGRHESSGQQRASRGRESPRG